MTTDIIREDIELLQVIDYPDRFQEWKLLEYEKYLNNKMDVAKYEKLQSGISYKTGRKITVGKGTYKKLKSDLFNKYTCSFDRFSGIIPREYLKQTLRKNLNVDIECYKNETRNLKLYDINYRKNKLTTWKDYIEFEGKKYGTNRSIIDRIHIVRGCGGYVKHTNTETHYGNCRPFYNAPDRSVYTYTCSKCGHNFTTSKWPALFGYKKKWT